jgi:exosome complex component RRP41
MRASTSGSALFRIGNTKVVAFVQGPHQITQRQAQTTGQGVSSSQNKGLLNVNFFVTNFSQVEHRSEIKGDKKLKEFTRMLKSVFERVIFMEKYPKSQIDLQVFVLEADGGYRSAAFNAVSLALMDAGIAMRDFVVATTAGLLSGGVAVLDLIYQEEKKQNCEFVLVYLLKAQQIAYMSLQCNKIRVGDFEKLLSLSTTSCEQVAEVMRAAVKAKVLKNINSFYFR